MKIKVEQKEFICNIKFVNLCNYAYAYTDWINNGENIHIFRNFPIIKDIINDPRQTVSVYCKTEFLLQFFNASKHIDKNFILISGCSDYPINEKLYKHKSDNIKKWYAENVDYIANDLIPLPLGSHVGTWIGTKQDAILYNHYQYKTISINNNPPKIKNLVFMCFSIHTNTRHRSTIYNYLKDKSWVNDLSKTKTGSYLQDDEFIHNIYNHSYIISPFGNGIDCGRTWVSLQLGCIPIIPYHTHFEEMAKHLPILLFKNINELTEEYLLVKLKEFKSKSYSYDYLKISYWKNEIEKNIQELNNK